MYIPQGAEPSLDFQQAVMACQRTALNPDDFSCIQLVYGNAGELFFYFILKDTMILPHTFKR